MKKPVVGVMPLWDDEKESLWMLPGYFDGIITNGGIPIMLPLTEDKGDLEQAAELCDGFLFTGGHDVSPEIYGEKPLDGKVSSNRKRDEMELYILRKALESDKPVLGICRGIQFINAALGGTLYQDIPLQHPSKVEHHQNPPYNIPVHVVSINVDSPLHKCLNADTLHVNSYHHQAVKQL
ncbi:MAG: gamma-glutamyl-gamma-aminobutyrate hydrolase family protein [Lachnospiraceae bacterium]|nr:gamma-glutamyl-gamma-aminobutyrate hydrolase family protein [Lachnospiraceae bacterium]